MALRIQIPPMLPVAAAVIAGIALWPVMPLPVWFSVAAVAACILLAMADYLFQGRGWAPLLVASMFSGMAVASLEVQADGIPEDRAYYRMVVESSLRPAGEWLRADAGLRSVESGGGSRQLRGRVSIMADTSVRLSAGQQIVWRGRMTPPGSDGYGELMRRRGYAGTAFVREGSIVRIDEGEAPLLVSLHERAVRRMSRLPLDKEEQAIILAVSTGETSAVSRTLRENYSRAGTSHVLALSGLHVGIVFLCINALLWWLPLLRRGHLWRGVLAVALLWSYVAVTGMPSSAVRAALMFTLLQTARLSSMTYSGLNALACSAFISLFFNANLIYEPGFRLSYAAVAGILAWGVPLCRELMLHEPPKRKRSLPGTILRRAANMLIASFAVGISASVATAPMVSHIFGSVPLLGAVASPVAVAAASVAVAASLLWLVMPLGFAAGLLGAVAGFAARVLNALSQMLAGCEYAAVDLRLDGWQTAAAYAVMIAATIAIAELRQRRRERRSRGLKI